MEISKKGNPKMEISKKGNPKKEIRSKNGDPIQKKSCDLKMEIQKWKFLKKEILFLKKEISHAQISSHLKFSFFAAMFDLYNTFLSTEFQT